MQYFEASKDVEKAKKASVNYKMRKNFSSLLREKR